MTAKCIDFNLSLLIDNSTYFKEVIQLLSIQSGARLTEVFNHRNYPNTIYCSARVRLIEVSVK